MSKKTLPSDLILVLGPHRSGSSALTRALSLLGYGLPKTLIKDNSSNRRGHWESQPIVRCNEAFMQDAGIVWSDWGSGDLPKISAERASDLYTCTHTKDLHYVWWCIIDLLFRARRDQLNDLINNSAFFIPERITRSS